MYLYQLWVEKYLKTNFGIGYSRVLHFLSHTFCLLTIDEHCLQDCLLGEFLKLQFSVTLYPPEVKTQSSKIHFLFLDARWPLIFIMSGLDTNIIFRSPWIYNASCTKQLNSWVFCWARELYWICGKKNKKLHVWVFFILGSKWLYAYSQVVFVASRILWLLSPPNCTKIHVAAVKFQNMFVSW